MNQGGFSRCVFLGVNLRSIGTPPFHYLTKVCEKKTDYRWKKLRRWPAPCATAKTLHRFINSTFLVREQLTGGWWGMEVRLNVFFFSCNHSLSLWCIATSGCLAWQKLIAAFMRCISFRESERPHASPRPSSAHKSHCKGACLGLDSAWCWLLSSPFLFIALYSFTLVFCVCG